MNRSWDWAADSVGVNHLRGHGLSPFIKLHEENPQNIYENLTTLLPHLGLIASGGNSILFLLKEDLSIEIIAQTIDDAAGEALDKGGKLLGLNYPAGPIIEQLAAKGNMHAIKFPIAFTSANELKFSFSGLKTSLRYYLEKISDDQLEREMPNICASYQYAVTEALAQKTKHVANLFDIKSIGLSGGVANNHLLREKLKKVAENKKVPFLAALPQYTTDNAAMIAFAAFLSPNFNKIDKNFNLSLDPSLCLT